MRDDMVKTLLILFLFKDFKYMGEVIWTRVFFFITVKSGSVLALIPMPICFSLVNYPHCFLFLNIRYSL